MVHREDEQVFGIGDAHAGRAQQRAGRQIERARNFVLRNLLRLAFRIDRRAHVDVPDINVGVFVDQLPRLAIDGHESGAQHLVAIRQIAKAGVQRVDVQLAAQTETERHVVRRRAGLELIEEPQTLLRVRHRQRRGARHADDRIRRPRRIAAQCLLDALGHLGDGRRFEDAPQRHLDVERLAHARDDARREQRVAAHLEEVVVDAEILDAEHFGLRPDLAEQALDRGSRRLIRFRVTACVDVGQRLAIDLAVHRQRQRVEHRIGRRHFVLRQLRAEIRTERRRVRRRRAGLRRHVRDEAAIAGRLLPDDDRRSRDAGVRGQRRLDLAQLDAVTADLHLVVEAAEIFDGSVGAVARAIAGAIQPRAPERAERIRDETFCRQVGASEIAAADTGAADVDLAGNTDGNLREVRVEQMHLQVRDRATDRHRTEVVVVRRVVDAAADDGFRRTVFVDEACARRMLAPELQRRSVERFAADDEAAHASAQIDVAKALLENLQVRRRELQQAQTVALTQFIRQRIDVGAGSRRRNEPHGPAGDKGNEETGDGEIEAE